MIPDYIKANLFEILGADVNIIKIFKINKKNNYFASDYTLYRLDRNVNNSAKKVGGGIIIGIKTSLISEQLLKSNVELLCIRITLDNADNFSLFIYSTRK